jgi:hypothetical protein
MSGSADGGGEALPADAAAAAAGAVEGECGGLGEEGEEGAVRVGPNGRPMAKVAAMGFFTEAEEAPQGWTAADSALRKHSVCGRDAPFTERHARKKKEAAAAAAASASAAGGGGSGGIAASIALLAAGGADARNEKARSAGAILRAAHAEVKAREREAAGPGPLCPWLHKETAGASSEVDRKRRSKMDLTKKNANLSNRERAAREEAREIRQAEARALANLPPSLPEQGEAYWGAKYHGREGEYSAMEEAVAAAAAAHAAAGGGGGGGVEQHHGGGMAALGAAKDGMGGGDGEMTQGQAAVKVQMELAKQRALQAAKEGRPVDEAAEARRERDRKRRAAVTQKQQNTEAAGRQLLAAAARGDIAAVRVLLDEYGCDPSLRPRCAGGATAAHRLAEAVLLPPGKKVALARLLVARGAVTGRGAPDEFGRSAHDVALATYRALCPPAAAAEEDSDTGSEEEGQTEQARRERVQRRAVRRAQAEDAAEELATKGGEEACGLSGERLERARAEALEAHHVLNPANLWRACLDGDLDHVKWLVIGEGAAVTGAAARCPPPTNAHGEPLKHVAHAAMTPLHYAAMRGRILVCHFLLEECGADPTVRAHDERRTTPHRLASDWLKKAEERERAAGMGGRKRGNDGAAKLDARAVGDKLGRCGYCVSRQLTWRKCDAAVVKERKRNGKCPACGKTFRIEKLGGGGGGHSLEDHEAEEEAAAEERKLARLMEDARGGDDTPGGTAVGTLAARRLVELLLRHDTSGRPPPADAPHACERYWAMRAEEATAAAAGREAGERERAMARLAGEWARGTTAGTALPTSDEAAEMTAAAVEAAVLAELVRRREDADADAMQREADDAEAAGKGFASGRAMRAHKAGADKATASLAAQREANARKRRADGMVAAAQMEAAEAQRCADDSGGDPKLLEAAREAAKTAALMASGEHQRLQELQHHGAAGHRAPGGGLHDPNERAVGSMLGLGAAAQLSLRPLSPGDQQQQQQQQEGMLALDGGGGGGADGAGDGKRAEQLMEEAAGRFQLALSSPKPAGMLPPVSPPGAAVKTAWLRHDDRAAAREAKARVAEAAATAAAQARLANGAQAAARARDGGGSLKAAQALGQRRLALATRTKDQRSALDAEVAADPRHRHAARFAAAIRPRTPGSPEAAGGGGGSGRMGRMRATSEKLRKGGGSPVRSGLEAQQYAHPGLGTAPRLLLGVRAPPANATSFGAYSKIVGGGAASGGGDALLPTSPIKARSRPTTSGGGGPRRKDAPSAQIKLGLTSPGERERAGNVRKLLWSGPV